MDVAEGRISKDSWGAVAVVVAPSSQHWVVFTTSSILPASSVRLSSLGNVAWAITNSRAHHTAQSIQRDIPDPPDIEEVIFTMQEHHRERVKVGR
jgi:hypothetical protein